MSHLKDDRSLNGWLIVPAASLIQFLAKEMVICSVTHRALISLQVLPSLLSVAKQYAPITEKSFHTGIAHLLQISTADQHFAKEEAENNYKTIFSHHAVATWGAIETTIDETLTNLIRRVDNSDELIKRNAPSISGKTIKTKTPNDARNARKIWEPSLKQHPDVIDRTIHMLAAFDLHISLKIEVRNRLSELAELRNVILHRGGVIDQRFKDKCPWHTATVEDLVTIDHDMMGKYFSAASDFAKSLLEQVTRSKYVRYAS